MHEGSIILLPVWVRPLGTSAIWVSITNGVLVDKFAIREARSFFSIDNFKPWQRINSCVFRAVCETRGAGHLFRTWSQSSRKKKEMKTRCSTSMADGER